mmetsp:Transcript_81665/g.144048  ORF Transcript_81665/g.144048 Transcript_81665/m.144048 type:complete len:206 (+) Transcript_81665:718-1335(+)
MLANFVRLAGVGYRRLAARNFFAASRGGTGRAADPVPSCTSVSAISRLTSVGMVSTAPATLQRMAFQKQWSPACRHLRCSCCTQASCSFKSAQVAVLLCLTNVPARAGNPWADPSEGSQKRWNRYATSRMCCGTASGRNMSSAVINSGSPMDPSTFRTQARCSSAVPCRAWRHWSALKCRGARTRKKAKYDGTLPIPPPKSSMGD